MIRSYLQCITWRRLAGSRCHRTMCLTFIISTRRRRSEEIRSIVMNNVSSLGLSNQNLFISIAMLVLHGLKLSLSSLDLTLQPWCGIFIKCGQFHAFQLIPSCSQCIILPVFFVKFTGKLNAVPYLLLFIESRLFKAYQLEVKIEIQNIKKWSKNQARSKNLRFISIC